MEITMNTSYPIRPIAILAFPGIEVLDITGPYEVFTFANIILQKEGITQEAMYLLTILAEEAGPVKTLSGIQIIANQSYHQIDTRFDTLIIPGGDPEVIIANTEVVDLIKVMAPKVRRLVSVCTGAFLLAETGLLDGCKATTHWYWCAEFAEKYPQVNIEPDLIFVKENNIFTSGGITSGIDLALAMVEEDWGQKLALAVAQFLVVFLKRPGGQSQFSNYLTREASGRSDLRDLQSWIIQNPKEDLRVEILAQRMAMSSRNFSRLFFSETGITPAKFVEAVRIDAARNLLELTKFPIDSIADSSGFKDTENMRRAFIRKLGVNPRDYRKRFGQFTTHY
ncbi:MAG: helix-turn-helix domain-containing protein [Methyloprofundus sp.]|nr:helix-turn-helix domain-containing protein [Methyloprofundus sp.]